MSSKGKTECCRVCGGALQGNQRRWLYGGQNRRSGQPQTPAEPVLRASLSRSSLSSPWGSTMSLGSSASLSKSQSLLSPSKGMDVLPVLTHILGRAVPRGSGRGEFLCSKCVSVLERVFKFDAVIGRVRALSSEQLQKLTQERDKVRQWVRHVYRQRHPQDFGTKGGEGSEEEEDGEGEREAYRDMLKDNMALSEYECWSEKWDGCPYFRRTGKRCQKGKDCEGCNSLRVSDSDYESVCGVPRRLPFLPFSPLALSRDKSRSMPLDWSAAPSITSRPASSSSLSGSSLSLRAPSRTESVQSVDSLDAGNDPFDWPGGGPVGLGGVLRELKGIEGKPVSSPPGSRIPVLERKEGRYGGEAGEGTTMSPVVTRALSFGEGEIQENGGYRPDGESGDVLTELRDEFIPFHRERTTGRMHLAVRQLRGQLDQATARVRTLEAELKRGPKPTAHCDVNGSEECDLPAQQEAGNALLQGVALCLHSRERVIQECLGLIRKLCVEAGSGSEDTLTDKLTNHLKEILSDNKRALECVSSEVTEREERMEREMEALRKAGRDRETDLNTLSAVLQGNQDVINELRVELGERERAGKEVQKEREVWRQREQALTAVLQEKEALLDGLKEALEGCQKHVQALSDSVICHGVLGGGAEGSLTSQVRETETLLTALLKDRGEQSATLCLEVTRLSAALQVCQAGVQGQQESHAQAMSSMTEQLRDTRRELREREKERKEVERALLNEREDREREQRRLRDSLGTRDKLIEQVLLDSEERDHLLKELQQNLLNKCEQTTAVKHTL